MSKLRKVERSEIYAIWISPNDLTRKVSQDKVTVVKLKENKGLDKQLRGFLRQKSF